MGNETEYDWIPFTRPRKSHRLSKKPRKRRRSFDGLTISKFKRISLPHEFCLKNKIKQYHYAVFYFDTTIPAIGIAFTTIKEPDCVLITWYQQTDTAFLSCANFFRANGLDATRLAGRYPYTVAQTEAGRPLYVIHLAKKG